MTARLHEGSTRETRRAVLRVVRRPHAGGARATSALRAPHVRARHAPRLPPDRTGVGGLLIDAGRVVQNNPKKYNERPAAERYADHLDTGSKRHAAAAPGVYLTTWWLRPCSVPTAGSMVRSWNSAPERSDALCCGPRCTPGTQIFYSSEGSSWRRAEHSPAGAGRVFLPHHCDNERHMAPVLRAGVSRAWRGRLDDPLHVEAVFWPARVCILDTGGVDTSAQNIELPGMFGREGRMT